MIPGSTSEFFNYSLFLSESSNYSWFYIRFRVLQWFLFLHQSSSMISGFTSEFFNDSWFYIRVLQLFLVFYHSSPMIPILSEFSNYSWFYISSSPIIPCFLSEFSPMIPGFKSEFSNYFWFYIRVLQCGVPSRGRLSEPFQFYSFINSIKDQAEWWMGFSNRF